MATRNKECNKTSTGVWFNELAPRNPARRLLLTSGERVSDVPCLLLILKTLIAFQKMFPQNCKKGKVPNKEHHKQDQSQNCDSILPNQRIVSKEGLHIDK